MEHWFRTLLALLCTHGGGGEEDKEDKDEEEPECETIRCYVTEGKPKKIRLTKSRLVRENSKKLIFREKKMKALFLSFQKCCGDLRIKMDSAERGEEESSTTFTSNDGASLVGYQLLADESGTSTTAAVPENSSSSSSSSSPKNFRRVKSNACVRASDGGWRAAVLEWLWSRSCRHCSFLK